MNAKQKRIVVGIGVAALVLGILGIGIIRKKNLQKEKLSVLRTQERQHK